MYRVIRTTNDNHIIQSDLQSIIDWSTNNYLNLHPTKNVHLCLNQPDSSIVPSYQLDNSPITTHHQHRDLGVAVSDNLSWTVHHRIIVSQAIRNLSFIRRTLPNITSPAVKRTLYISPIKSKLSCCSEVWRPHLITDILKIERVQRRATKFILNDYHSDYKTRLLSLTLLPLMMEFELKDIFFNTYCESLEIPRFIF